MRQLIVKVSGEKAGKVLSAAKELEAKNVMQVLEQEKNVLYLHLGNNKIDQFIRQLTNIASEAEITLIPRGVVTLHPPASEAPDQVTDVSQKSSLEIYLSGLQSVGSIKGMIGYSLASGLVAATGLYTETWYLLTASMLIAPFAGPAMNASLGSAAGEWGLLVRSMGRYFLSLGITILASALLSFIIGLSNANYLMISISHISSLAIALPLTAGFAGAISLVQSDRDSLVSGAAVGVLVAASLAPPAALIGMAAVIGEWQIVKSGFFLIILQLAGIHLAATLVFRLYGKINIDRARFGNGTKKVFFGSLTVSVLVMAALLTYQFLTPVDLQRGSIKTRVENTIANQVKQIEGLELVEVTSRFTGHKINNQQPLVNQILLLNQDADSTSDEKKKRLIEQTLDQLRKNEINTKVIFDVSFAER